MHIVFRASLITILAAFLLATPATGQEEYGLTFVAGLGYERGGPGSSLVESLDAAGYGQTRNEFGSGVVEYPRYYNEGLNLSVFLGLRYRYGPVSFETLFSNGSRGHAEGYNSQASLLVSWTSLRAATTIGLHLGPVRLAAGPTLDAVSWEAEENWSNLGKGLTPALGGTASAGISFPIGRERIAITAGARTFPTMDLASHFSRPVEARYGTFFIAVTVLPG